MRDFIRTLPKNQSSLEDGKQLIRSSGSVGANYIEANESLSKKDFVMRIKICLKEAKESTYWLNLLHADDIEHTQKEHAALLRESKKLTYIFSSILSKTSS
jgi:four helix bundle protein